MRLTFPLTASQHGNACVLVETATIAFAIGSHLPSDTAAAPPDIASVAGVKPTAVDFVLLAHARAGHGGFLASLVDGGFTGPIYGAHDSIDALARGRSNVAVGVREPACATETENQEQPAARVEPDDASTLDRCLEQARRISTGRLFAPHVGLRCRFRDLWPGHPASAVEVAATEWGFLTTLLYLRLPANAPAVALPESVETSTVDILILDLGSTAGLDPAWLRPWLGALPQQPSRIFVLNGPVASTSAWTRQLHDECGGSIHVPEPGHRELWPEFLAVP